MGTSESPNEVSLQEEISFEDKSTEERYTGTLFYGPRETTLKLNGRTYLCGQPMLDLRRGSLAEVVFMSEEREGVFSTGEYVRQNERSVKIINLNEAIATLWFEEIRPTKADSKRVVVNFARDFKQ